MDDLEKFRKEKERRLQKARAAKSKAESQIIKLESELENLEYAYEKRKKHRRDYERRRGKNAPETAATPDVLEPKQMDVEYDYDDL